MDIKDEKERENEKCKFRHICLRFGLTKNKELGYFKIKNKNINLDKNMSEEEIKVKEIVTKEYTIFYFLIKLLYFFENLKFNIYFIFNIVLSN